MLLLTGRGGGLPVGTSGRERQEEGPLLASSKSLTIHRDFPSCAQLVSPSPETWVSTGGKCLRRTETSKRLTEWVRSKGVGRRLLLFGLQVRGVRGEAVGGRLACSGVQRQVRRRRLHEQGLGQLALVLLDLLLQVSDCARDLGRQT